MVQRRQEDTVPGGRPVEAKLKDSAVALENFEADEHIFYLLGQVYGRRMRDLAEALRPFGLTNAKYRVLAGLLGYNGCTIGKLADLTVVERTTLSRALDQMAGDGLIKRVQQEGNRRSTEVWLTRRGREMLKRIWPVVQRQNENAIQGFSLDEVETLKSWLRRMAKMSADDNRTH